MSSGKDTKKPNPQSQLDKFKEAARELETNEDEAAFDRALKKIAPKNTGPQEPSRDHGKKTQSSD